MMEKRFMAITTVYSYRFPEIRKLITKLACPFPHEVYKKSINPAGGLDDFHEPIIDRLVDFYSGYVPSLNEFGYRYPTSGSEEGIRETMTWLQSRNIKRIYTFGGEYEGYREVGKTRNMETIELDFDIDPESIEPGFWFISNPSAIDGNIIPNRTIRKICEAGHKVFYDLAYLGSTRKHKFDLNHENIFAAVISFSKPCGLFYDRVGFTFSRNEIQSLHANRWFKNIFGLLIADKIMAELKPDCLYNKYRPVQENIIKMINGEFGLNMRKSDAILLGHLKSQDTSKLKKEQLKIVAPFRRGNGCRFCLTPYYQMLEEGD